MSDVEFLMWVRGPGLVMAFAIFVFGLILRLIEVYSLGHKPDLAPAREVTPGSPWRTMFTRSAPADGLLKKAPVLYIGGYIFHLGLFITFFLFIPHIEFLRNAIGIGWPGLPTPVVDFVAVITLLTLVLTLTVRIADPVKRFLSNADDYVGWTLTFLPVLTGWMAYHHFMLPYTWMLAIHIFTVMLLLIALPFGKLGHFFTLFISRWYNGNNFARKGVAS